MALWDDRSIPRDSMGLCLLKRDEPQVDSFGSAAFFSRNLSDIPGRKLTTRELYYHPTTSDSTVASHILEMFIQAHWDLSEFKNTKLCSEYFEPESFSPPAFIQCTGNKLAAAS